MDLVSRLKQYLDSRQISVTQFADECSIPRPTASQLLAGRNKKVSDEIIGKIHQCYPDLNIIWLMFGEGSMSTGTNIETLKAQNNDFFSYHDEQLIDNQFDNPQKPRYEDMSELHSEKVPDSTTLKAVFDVGQPSVQSDESSLPGSEFSFSVSASDDTSTFAFTPSASEETQTKIRPKSDQDALPHPITLTPGKGKKVTGIVVYYDDSTFESFMPDPDHSIPFLR